MLRLIHCQILFEFPHNTYVEVGWFVTIERAEGGELVKGEARYLKDMTSSLLWLLCLCSSSGFITLVLLHSGSVDPGHKKTSSSLPTVCGWSHM